MQKVYEELTLAFRKHGGVLSDAQYHYIVDRHCTLLESSDTIFLLLQASGYPISLSHEGYYRLETFFTDYSSQRYCIFDIETNGSKPTNSQIIEIGAVMIDHGEIVDRFESFVACTFVPDYITKVTGIKPADLIDAPSLKQVLREFRTFLGDAVCVAHNADFDYHYLSASLERFGLGGLGNPKLCTIDLAKRTFESERYGLAYLIDFLEIERATHHRAYSDAYCAFKVMEKSLEGIPEYVSSADELIRFSKSSRKERREKREQGVGNR